MGKGAKTTEKETHFYVKFYVRYTHPLAERLGLRFMETVVADSDIPLRKLTPRELKFLKKNTRENWLMDDRTREIAVLDRVRAATPVGHYEALIAWMHASIDYKGRY